MVRRSRLRRAQVVKPLLPRSRPPLARPTLSGTTSTTIGGTTTTITGKITTTTGSNGETITTTTGSNGESITTTTGSSGETITTLTGSNGETTTATGQTTTTTGSNGETITTTKGSSGETTTTTKSTTSGTTNSGTTSTSTTTSGTTSSGTTTSTTKSGTTSTTIGGTTTTITGKITTTTGSNGETITTTTGSNGESITTTTGSSGETITTLTGSNGETTTATGQTTTTAGSNGETITTTKGSSGETTTTTGSSGETVTTSTGSSGETTTTTTTGSGGSVQVTTTGSGGSIEITTKTPGATPAATTPGATPAATPAATKPSATPAATKPSATPAATKPSATPAATTPSATPATTTKQSETCIDVSVEGDATYCVEGPICSGSGDSPSGTQCPVKGDVAVQDCHENLSSYTNSSTCVAPQDAVCAKIKTGAWGCVFGEAATPAPTKTMDKATPAPTKTETSAPAPTKMTEKATPAPTTTESEKSTPAPTVAETKTTTPTPAPTTITTDKAMPAPTAKDSTPAPTTAGPSTAPTPCPTTEVPSTEAPTPCPEKTPESTTTSTPAPTTAGPSTAPTPCPTTVVPSTEVPSTGAPTPCPTTVVPSTEVPSTEAPTPCPTTVVPSTEVPSTEAPTPCPTTVVPSTEVPSTEAPTPCPTTVVPSTEVPSTEVPSTEAPTPCPTTVVPSTEVPSTEAPTPFPTIAVPAKTGAPKSETSTKTGTNTGTQTKTETTTSSNHDDDYTFQQQSQQTQQSASSSTKTFSTYAATTADSDSTNKSTVGLSTPAIAAIVAAVCAVVGLAGFTAYRIRQRSNGEDMSPSGNSLSDVDASTSAGGNAACGQGQRVRKAWSSMTGNEKNLYLEAMNVAISSGAIEQFAAIHVEPTGNSQAHRSCGFFSWHRRLLIALESYLRDQDPKFVCLTLPYYDVQTAYVRQAAGQCKNFYDCSTILQEIGGNKAKNQQVSITQNGETATGYPVTGSPLNAECDDNNVCGYSVRSDMTTKPVPSAAGFASFLSVVRSSADYATFLEGIQFGVHNEMHNAVGGSMATFASPRDPFFYSWHAAIDMFLHVYHLCNFGAPLSEEVLLSATKAFTKATDTCDSVSGVGPNAKIVQNVIVNDQTIDVADHPTLGNQICPAYNPSTPTPVPELSSSGSYSDSFPGSTSESTSGSSSFRGSYSDSSSGSSGSYLDSPSRSTSESTSGSSSFRGSYSDSSSGSSSTHGYYPGSSSNDNGSYVVSPGDAGYDYYNKTEIPTHSDIYVVDNSTDNSTYAPASNANSGGYWQWTQTTYDGLFERFNGDMDLVVQQMHYVECEAYNKAHGIEDFSDDFVQNFHLASSRPICGKKVDQIDVIEEIKRDYVPTAAVNTSEQYMSSDYYADAQAKAQQTPVGGSASTPTSAGATQSDYPTTYTTPTSAPTKSAVDSTSTPPHTTGDYGHKHCELIPDPNESAESAQYLGVVFDASKVKKYSAELELEGHVISGGDYWTALDAAKAYDELVALYCDLDAPRNFPEGEAGDFQQEAAEDVEWQAPETGSRHADIIPPVPRTYLTIDEVTDALAREKAIDVYTVDLAGKSSLADFMVFATGRSQAHMRRMADLLIKSMKAREVVDDFDYAVEGRDCDDWMIADCNNIVVHLMRADTRRILALEDHWENMVDDKHSVYGDMNEDEYMDKFGTSELMEYLDDEDHPNADGEDGEGSGVEWK
ncbi:unnamed protein product [Phytophthora fragariaefolia]|uniref:Unnamed protein product n=1 Tax=Phytophthora fragariaefolia TaxID=1490495 RepID=A0A9W6Y670_9STRA|nr:unnamed protein product [Phytophthora fragariaefolia]